MTKTTHLVVFQLLGGRLGFRTELGVLHLQALTLASRSLTLFLCALQIALWRQEMFEETHET